MRENKQASFDHKRRIAKISISTSAFRNQGKSGLIRHTQTWITNNIKLEEFASALNKKTYMSYLDKQTKRLYNSSGKFNCRWGTSRKGLNIFFRDILYSSYFFTQLKLSWDHGWQLEIPLDSKTMKKIRQKYRSNQLHKKGLPAPEPTTIIALDKKNSAKYQDAATKIAKVEYRGYTRVDLDMEFWAE